MNKNEFLGQLRKGLAGLPQKDIEERVNFYSEIIDDRMEEGLSEETAVGQIGPVEVIIAQIRGEAPKAETPSRRGWKVWQLLLLILGSPLWFSLLMAAFAVVLSVYISLWSVIVSLWAAFASVAACGAAGVLTGVVFSLAGYVPTGVTMVAAAIVCAGLSILLFLGCRAATKGTVWLTGKLALGIKNCVVKKEGAA